VKIVNIPTTNQLLAGPTGRASRRRLGRAALPAVVAGALVATVISGCTSTLGYAAIVNGTAISQTQLNNELADISHSPKYVQLINQPGNSGPVAGSGPGTYNKAFVAVLLDQQIQFEVIRQKLVASKAMPTAAQIASVKDTVSQGFPTGIFSSFSARYQNQLDLRQAEIDSYVNVATPDLTGSALTQYYQSHLADYATEACVRHILISDKDASGQLDYTASLADAQKIKAQLDAGGDFAALAKQYSQDNQGTGGGSAAVGGVLTGSAADGCLSTADLQQTVTEFAQAVVSLPVNQISDPVKTSFGYHIIEVTSRASEPLDDTVTMDIHRRVAGQRLNALVAQAHVKINPAFGTFNNTVNTNGQITGVIAPIVPNLTTTTTAASSPAGSTPASSGG
jgi:PPIC-type PPIASE domain